MLKVDKEMASYANLLPPPLDFSEALRHDPAKRMRMCLERVPNQHIQDDVCNLDDIPLFLSMVQTEMK